MLFGGNYSNKFMLALKKISTKKLAVSLTIIFIMICGTGFMLYQNKKLTTRKTSNVNPSFVFNNTISVVPFMINNQAASAPNQISDTTKINQGDDFNLSIFSSDKFKNLQTNISIIKEQSEVGKRDPFKPN